MNAVIMDNVIVGDECIIGALCFIKAAEHIPARSMVVGNPGKIIKEVSNEMLQWKTRGTALYQALPADLHENLTPCEPLTEVETGRPVQESFYKMWKEEADQ